MADDGMCGDTRSEESAHMRDFIPRYSLAAFLLVSGSLWADTIYSAQFQGTASPVNFQGVEADAAAADAAFASSNQWNHLQPNGTMPFTTNLITSTGTSSGASFTTQIVYSYNAGSHDLPDGYFYQYSANGLSTPFTISGLAPNESFALFLYAYNSQNSPNDRGESFTVGNSTFDSATGNAASLDPTHAVDGLITGVTSSSGTISGTWNFDPSNQSGEIDWSGFQLDVSSAVVAPEPGTIVLLAGGLGLMILGGRRFMNKGNLHV
jgi:hypothetical protein